MEDKKVAIVTGASKGIGAQIAKSLGKSGTNVVVNYFKDELGATNTVKEITDNGGNAKIVQADVTKLTDVKRLFQEAVNHFGKIDTLVNNAGVYHFEPIETVTEIEFNRQFNNNVLSVVLTAQESLNHFNTKGGSIINISSIASTFASPMSVVYSATKSAVDSITRVLSKELGARNIRINSVLPGPTQTEGNQVIGTDMEKHITSNTPLGRIGQPQDVAGLVTFLASDEASWITGQKIGVSGGFD